MEPAALKVEGDTLRRLALVALTKVQEVRGGLGANVRKELERDSLGVLLPDLQQARCVRTLKTIEGGFPRKKKKKKKLTEATRESHVI